MSIMRKMVLLALMVLANCNIGFAFTPEEILKKVDEIRAPADKFSFDLEINTIKNGKNKRTERYSILVGGPDRTLIKFIYPAANKGKFLLMSEDNLWFYAQGIRKPMRITLQQRLLGQVSNGDVARVVFHIDYLCISVEPASEGRVSLSRLVLEAKSKMAAYGKIVLYINKNNYKPAKAEFYTPSGKLLKTASYTEYAYLFGEERLTIMEIYDELRKGETSVLNYSNYKISDFPDAYFQKEYLKHIQ